MNAKITSALFVSHGSPMNAIAENQYTRDLRRIGERLKDVRAVLIISAHWETNGLFVTASETLATYHDFRGFPAELFAVQYPVKGALDLIPEIEKLVGEEVKQDTKRGLDHGAWSMLVHLFPEKNIPVLQLSMDRTKTFEQHLELARKLSSLRKENVLILASGNVTHNLFSVDFSNENKQPVDWALKFDEKVKRSFETDQPEVLLNIKEDLTLYKMNHPSDDHYIPLLYTAGLRMKDDKVEFPHMSWQFGTFSMRHILLSNN